MRNIKVCLLKPIFTIVVALAVLVSFPMFASADNTVLQLVRNQDGSAGTEATPNSFGRARYFRPEYEDYRIVPSGYEVSAETTSLSQYYVAQLGDPAIVILDVGSQWGIAPSIGQVIFGIVEVPGGLRTPYSGLSYIGALPYTITDAGLIEMPDVWIQPIPTPESWAPQQSGRAKIKWTGVTTSDAIGNLVNTAETYSVYRSTNPSGAFVRLEKTARHVSGEVFYEDTYDITAGQTYYYKLRMQYSWPENDVKPYYETSVESRVSAPIVVPQAAPTVNDVNPDKAPNNSSHQFVITGTNLTNIDDVRLKNSGVYIDNITYESQSSTQINAQFSFSPETHTIGTWEVELLRGADYYTSAPLLTLTSEAPSIASVEPVTAGTNGTVTGFKLYGQRLYGGTGTSIVLTKEGQSNIMATGVATGPGYSTMTCNIALSNATIGPWNVTYTNMFGQKAASLEGFIVTAEAPTATSISPATGTKGTTVNITSLSGENLFNDTTVKMQRAGRPTVDAIEIVANASHTSLSFSLPIYATAETGSWDMFILNSDGKSVLKPGFFTVTAAPTVAAVSPDTAGNSGTVSVRIDGSNFFPPTTARLEKTVLSTLHTVEATISASTDSTVDCTFDITNRTIGSWNVVVQNADGIGTLTNGFTVTSEAPTFTSIVPNSGDGGSTLNATITGTKFYDEVLVQLRRTGRSTVTAEGVSVHDINTINCTFSLPNLAPDLGLWDIYIQNSDGKSTFSAEAFLVERGAITTPENCAITALTPNSVKVTWDHVLSNEDLFRIESSTNGTVFVPAGTVESSIKEYTGDGTTGLAVNSRHWFRVRSEGGERVTAWSTAEPKYTLAAAPSAEVFGDSTSTVVTANWSAGDNPAGTLYYCQNQTNSNNSGNISALTWADTGLLPDTTYTYRVRGVNGDAIGGEWTSLGTSTTKAKRSLYFFAVDNVKLLSGDIIGSTSNISAVFSSESGIDMTSFRMEINGVVVTGGTGESIYYDSYTVDGILTTVNYKIKSPLAESTYTIKAYATDPSGVLYEDERTNLQVMAEGTKAVVGYVLPHPNPFDPVTGPVKLTYRLATDTNVTIYVFDVNGRLAWKESYLSGFNGGKAGYNEVLWNGYDAFSRILDNDVYLIRIVESGTGRVMGKGKIVVVKSVSNRGEDDSSVKAAAAPVYEDGNGPFSNGLNGMAGLGKAILLGLVGLIAFEEVVRMYFTVKKVGRLKR